jgi:hypothetical protein
MDDPGGYSATGDGPRNAGLDDLLERLDLGVEDFDDFVIEEEDPVVAESTRWLAVARVHCQKRFSHDAFTNQMQYAWNPAREISIRPIGEN